MRAIQIFHPGGPEVLTEVEIPTPEPEAGEVRVKAEAIGIGRPDILVRKGIYKWMPPLPVIPGSEMVGIVDALGSGVDKSLQGRRVLVSARELKIRAGCCAEYICVPAQALYVLPDAIDPTDAASLPNLQFANAIWMCNGGRPVESVLIPGASGGVASILTRLAHHKNARVIGTTSSVEKRDYILENGVDHLLDAPAETLSSRVLEVTGGRGVDLAVDQLGGDFLKACLRSLAPMGMVVSINIIKGLPADDIFQEMRALLSRSLAIRTFSMHTLDEDAVQRRALMDLAIGQMARGDVKAPKATVLHMSDIQKAHQMLDAGVSMGKIVLKP
jgi:NADPH2:quinone reductase